MRDNARVYGIGTGQGVNRIEAYPTGFRNIDEVQYFLLDSRAAAIRCDDQGIPAKRAVDRCGGKIEKSIADCIG